VSVEMHSTRSAVPHIFVTLLLSVGFSTPSSAGPCKSDIIRLQVQVDAAIEAHANTAPFGREGRIATYHLQPTPKSIARAEKQLSGWTGGLRSIRALQRARRADQTGDSDGCRHALLAARHALQATP
jgi:hypothetical protein